MRRTPLPQAPPMPCGGGLSAGRVTCRLGAAGTHADRQRGHQRRRRAAPRLRDALRHQRGRREGAALGRADGQPVGVAEPRARHRRQPAQQLCAGPAAQLARLRCARHLRHPRPAPVHRRHPGHHARRPGPGVALRHRRRAAHRGAARPVLGAVRRQLRRRDLAGQRRAHRQQLRHRRRRRQQRPVAGAAGRRSAAVRRLEHPRAGQPVQHRRRAPAQRRRAHAGQPAPGLGRRAGHGDAAAEQRRPAGAGPAGPDARAVRRRPVPDHAAGHPVQHAQDQRPDAGRRQLAPPLHRQPAP